MRNRPGGNHQNAAGCRDGHHRETPTDTGAGRCGHLPLLPLESTPDLGAGERGDGEDHIDSEIGEEA